MPRDEVRSGAAPRAAPASQAGWAGWEPAAGHSPAPRKFLAFLPIAVLLSLYYPVFGAWFQADDLAWLSLKNTLANGKSIWWVLFSPQAQGTIRPLSERLYFLAIPGMFGFDPVPFRIAAIATQALNLLLVVAIGRRMTGRLWAGGAAAALWAVNPNVAIPLSWASAYNQVLLAFCVLGGFYALLRHREEQGRGPWFVVVWAAFCVGLATNEAAIVFPAIAGLYLYFFDRPRVRLVLPMAAVAIAYSAVHVLAAPVPKSGPYTFHIDRSVVSSLAQYWSAAVGASKYFAIHGLPAAWSWFVAAALAGALGIASVVHARKGERAPLFWLACWFVALMPVLGFADHVSDYYLFLPAAFLSLSVVVLIAGARAWSRAVAALALAAYAGAVVVPTTLFVRDWHLARAAQVKAKAGLVLETVTQARRMRPGAGIFVRGIDDEQFWYAFCYGMVPARGLKGVYLAPDAPKRLFLPPRNWCASDFVSPAPPDRNAVMVDFSSGRPVESTSIK